MSNKWAGQLTQFMNKADSLLQKSMQDYLQMELDANFPNNTWREPFEKIVDEGYRSAYSSKYAGAWGKIQDKGIDNYSASDMDVTIIAAVLLGNNAFSCCREKTVKTIIKELRDARNDIKHAPEEMSDFEKYNLIVGTINKIKRFTKEVKGLRDDGDQKVSQEIRSAFQEKYRPILSQLESDSQAALKGSLGGDAVITEKADPLISDPKQGGDVKTGEAKNIPDKALEISGIVSISPRKRYGTNEEFLLASIEKANFPTDERHLPLEERRNTFFWTLSSENGVRERPIRTGPIFNLRPNSRGKYAVCEVTRKGMIGAIKNAEPFYIEAEQTNNIPSGGSIMLSKDDNYFGEGIRLIAAFNDYAHASLQKNGATLTWGYLADDGKCINMVEIKPDPMRYGTFGVNYGNHFSIKMDDEVIGKRYFCALSSQDGQGEILGVFRPLCKDDFLIKGTVSIKPDVGGKGPHYNELLLCAKTSGANFEGKPKHSWLIGERRVETGEDPCITISKDDIGKTFVCEISREKLFSTKLSEPVTVTEELLNSLEEKRNTSIVLEIRKHQGEKKLFALIGGEVQKDGYTYNWSARDGAGTLRPIAYSGVHLALNCLHVGETVQCEVQKDGTDKTLTCLKGPLTEDDFRTNSEDGCNSSSEDGKTAEPDIQPVPPPTLNPEPEAAPAEQREQDIPTVKEGSSEGTASLYSSDFFELKEPDVLAAPYFSCFNSDTGRLQYFVAPRNDFYAVNTLEYLNYYSFLNLLLHEQGYERVLLVQHKAENKGNNFPVLAFDRKSELSFLNPAVFEEHFADRDVHDEAAWEEFCGRFAQEKRERTDIRSAHNGRTRTARKSENSGAVFGRRVVQVIIPESSTQIENEGKVTFEAFISNLVVPALEQKRVKTAIVLPIELFKKKQRDGKPYPDAYIAQLIRDQINEVGENLLLVTLEHKAMLSELFDIPEYSTIEAQVYSAVTGLQESRDPMSRSQAIYDALTVTNESGEGEEESVRILIADRRPGKDEIANLLLNKIINHADGFSELPYAKVYALSEFLYTNCKNKKQTKEAFPVLEDNNKWDVRQLALLHEKLGIDRIRDALIRKANELPSRMILPASEWKASCIERIYTKIDVVPTKKDRKISYSGTPVVDREEISASERAAMREKALTKLNELIGLTPVKTRLINLLDAAKNEKAHKDKLCPGHYIFTGNPGTGKTTVARLVGDIMRSEGLLKKGHVVEVKKADLVADHIGGTQAKALAKFEEALDGVLFFDEAYELVDSSPTADSKFNSPFDEEAYTLLLKFMEDNRDRVCIICAGYKERMEKFLDANEGMRDRFSATIEFPDYSADELYSILRHDLQEMTNFLITDGYLAEAKKVMAHMSEDAASGLEQFSNARSVRRFVEESILCATARDSETDKLTEEDIPPKYKSADLSAAESRKLQEQAWAKLDEMIGLGGIKAKLRGLIEYSARAAGKNRAPGHYAFVGNPGTGKTETARLMADILHANGLLRTNNFVEAKGADLVGKYIGHSAPQALAKCEEAIDGVLFIDEAYTLVSNDPINGPFASSFAKESYEAIMKFMEDYRQRICVIFAGYKDEMDTFLDANPGMRSRISPANVIEFKDFSDDELIQITELMAEKRDDFHFVLTEEYLNSVRTLLPKMRTAKNFGNARAMREFLNECIPVYMQRIPRTERVVLDDGVEQIILTADDIPERFRAKMPIQAVEEESAPHPVFHILPKSILTELPNPFAGIDIHSNAFPGLCCNAVAHINNEYGDASAFVITPDGYAITCAHAVAYKKDLTKIARSGLLADFKIEGGFKGQLPYEIINIRPDLDLALIKIKADWELPYLKLAPEDREINIGEVCGLYGFPDGREGIMQFPGTVSTQAEKGGDGELGSIYYFSGEAHPGNSGGPVIATTDGCVIGVLRGARGPKGSTMHNYMKPVSYFWKEFLK